MLNTMRDLSKSLVSKLLMAALVVSFAVWGVGDIANNNGPSYAVKVGDDKISVGEFQQQRSQMARQLEAVGIKDLPAGQLESSVIRQLVQQKLMLMAMHDMGLVVNDKLVGKIVADLPEFKGKNGKFDGALFNSFLERQNLTEKAFLAQFKRDAAGRFLSDSLEMRDAKAPSSVVALEAMIAGETRDAVLFTIPAKAAGSEPDDAMVRAFYEQNKQIIYMRPESRTLEYVVLTQAEIDTLVDHSITDEMVESAAALKPDLAKPLLRMKLRTEKRDEVLRNFGNTIEDELAAGKSMGEAFAKAGINTSPRILERATEQDKASTDDVVKTVAEQGFGLSEGEISRLITTKKGVLLMVSAKKINAAEAKPYEEVQADAKARFARQLARDDARSKAVTVKEALGKSPNWQAVSEENKLSNRVVSRVARPVEDKAGGSEGLPPSLQQAIFERGIGEVAGPLTLDNGDQVLALVTASHLPEVNKQAAAKDTSHLAEKLGNDVQNRAYLSFAERHPVKVNPAMMRALAEEQ